VDGRVKPGHDGTKFLKLSVVQRHSRAHLLVIMLVLGSVFEPS